MNSRFWTSLEVALTQETTKVDWALRQGEIYWCEVAIWTETQT